ncbi:RHS repeat-associated core domain-containing protein [Myxococcaceae bacterium GXIMD 01537]
MKRLALVGAVLLAVLAGCGDGASTPAKEGASGASPEGKRAAAPADALRTAGSKLESGGGTSSGSSGGASGTEAGGPEAGGSSAGQSAPSLTLETPVEGALVGAGGVSVVGRVEGGTPPMRVAVAGQDAAVVAGAFSGRVSLAEGEHTLEVRVTDAEGRTAVTQRAVRVDATPPSLQVTSPTAGVSAAAESPFLVTGLAGDVHLAGVSVQGTPVPLVAGYFSAAVPLSAGSNTVRIIATDLAGNQTVEERTLTLASQAPSVVILEPLPGTEAAQAVVRVRARVTSVAPLAEVRVGTGEATLTGPQEYSAEVPLALGENSLTVFARDTDGLSSSATVQVRYRSAAEEPLSVSGVEPLPGSAEVETDAIISVSFNKAVRYELLPGHFTVSADGVALEGGYSLAPGGQTASFVPREPLPEGKRLTVRVSGVVPVQSPGMSGEFTSDFTVRPPLTRARGLVVDVDRHPLGGVTVSAEGLGLSTQTGPDGNWVLFLPRGGEYTVRYEGGLRSTGEHLPTVRRRLFVSEGVLTTDLPLVLTPIDTASSEAVDVTKPIHLGFAGRHPGLSLQVAAEGLSFEDGHTTDFVTATRLQPYALPVPLMGQAAPVGLWQLSPAGLRAKVPVALRLPNLTGAPAGRLALVLGYDATRHVLERVAFARVSTDGSAIVLEEPLKLGALDFIGYMPLSEEQHAQVAVALGLADGASGAGPDGGTPSLDGGLGARMPAGVQAPRSPWWDLLLFPFGASEAHAMTLAELFGGGLSSFDALNELNTPGTLSGYVRMPREREVLVQRTFPPEEDFQTPRQVTLPYELPVDFEVRFEAANSMDALVPETVEARARAEVPGSGPLPVLAGHPAENVGVGVVRLLTRFQLPLGKTRLWLTGSSLTDSKELEFEAELTPGDAGSQATLVLRKVADTTPATDPALRASPRLKDLAVTVTGPAAGGAGVTGQTGQYSVAIRALPPYEQGVACTEVPLGPRLVEHVGPTGATRYSSVMHMLPVCSHSFSIYPGRSTQADIIVDARLLYGSLTFKNRGGAPLDVSCEEGARSVRGETPGEYDSLSPEDVRSTEVHFFREDDLKNPIATFDVGRPDPRACEGGSFQPGAPHGMYSRIRIGPASALKKYALERCRELVRKARNPDEEAFFQANCQDNRTNFLSLSTGDRLVVFAINHATGYSGMTTVTVPPITRSTVDGGTGPGGTGVCQADVAAGGPLLLNEYDAQGNQLSVSRCTLQELGIAANLDLYPPEVEVRVGRRAEDEGLKTAQAPSLVRHGGSATTRDDFLYVNTHWRVRIKPSTHSVDAGVADAGSPCVWERLGDGGFRPDGGNCGKGGLVDYGEAGTLLEVLCSELPPDAPEAMRATCLNQESDVVDVPPGITPLAGHVVGVTQTAGEVPAVVPFLVRPGRHTATVQASLRYRNAAGQIQALSTLPKANYYVHVVGHPMLPRDTNQDGFIQPSEQNKPAPDFSMPQALPPGYPAGLPARAIGLKNVYRHIEANRAQLERYDRALEHEFRVLQLGPTQVTANSGSAGSAGGRDLKQEVEPAAQEDDVSYELLSALLAPTEPGRAGTLSGEYIVRLGSDEYGIECPFVLNTDPAVGSIKASCGGDHLADILNANDILYLELFLSGNAENVLYRFNLFGLAKRTDMLSAGSAFTARASVTPDSQGNPAPGRPVSQPGLANFFVEPAQFHSGVVRVCLNAACSPADMLLKEARLELQSSGLYSVTPTEAGIVQSPLVQSRETGLKGARLFTLALPPHVAAMPGSGNPARPIYVIYAPEAPTVVPRVEVLGRTEGTYEGFHAMARGQETVAGVNLADGHLSFTHTDFSVPYYAGTFAFSRTYNNQNNQPTPLGLGWMHSLDGWVFEEEPQGRYTAVLSGQTYAFPQCEPIDGSETRVRCTGDRAHGHVLVVEAPVRASPTDSAPPVFIEMTSPDGSRARFERVSMKGEDVGRRRWLLTAFEEGHGGPLTPRADGSGFDGTHWTHVRYEGETDRIATVERTPGLVRLQFEYSDVEMDAPETPERIRSLVRTRGFKFLSAVRLESTGGNLLYRVDFTHDARGNLTSAARSPGVPFQRWMYDYESGLGSLQGSNRWVATNELRGARLIHGASLDAVSPVQWRASYAKSASPAKFAHVNPLEMIGSVTQTGQQGMPLVIDYVTETTRKVTAPDEVVLWKTLNVYGNVSASQTPLAQWSADWNSSQPGMDVTVQSVTNARGLKLGMQNNAALAPTTTTLDTIPTGSLPAKLDVGSPLQVLRYERPGSPGLATGGSFQSGSGTVDWSAPRTSPSGPESLSLSDSTLGLNISLLGNAQYDDYGRMTSAVDAQQRLVTFTYPVPATGLGLAASVTLTEPTAGAGGLSSLTRALTWDDYGRLLSVVDVETGAKEDWTHDGLGRTLTHVRAGTPAQSWAYGYTATDDTLVVAETLDLSASGASNHERTTKWVGGLKVEQSEWLGKPARKVTKTFAYNKGRLISSLDEGGTSRTYLYDSAGRLEFVKVGAQVETAYGLDADGNPLTVTDSLQRVTTLQYDWLGRPVSWDYGHGDKEVVLLDSNGAEVRRAFGRNLGHVLETTADALGRPRKVKSLTANGGVERITEYDAAGRLASVHDVVMGLHEAYEYKDVLGRLTRRVRTLDKGGSELKSTETRTYLDSEHKVTLHQVSDTGFAGQTRTEEETRTFDKAGRVLKVERQVDGTLAAHEYTYDARGQVLTHTEPQVPGQQARAVTRYEYDPQGNLLSVEDPGQYKRTYTLDDAGRVATESGPHPGYSVTYHYDALGRLDVKTVSAFTLTPEGITTPEAVWTYDYGQGVGKVVESGPEGLATTRILNARNRLVSEVRSGTGGEQTLTVEVDGPWEAKRILQEGTASTTWTRQVDDRGRPLLETEVWSGGGVGYNYSTTTQWTNRAASVVHAWQMRGESRGQTVTQQRWDSLGNPQLRTVGSYTDTWAYGADGLVTVSQPAGLPETKYGYSNGLLKTESFASEPSTEYSYFADGRLKERLEPTGRKRKLEYNLRGLVSAETYGRDSEWQRTEYLHGADGAITDVTYGATSTDAQTWKYLRGSRGELLGVVQPGALGTFKYTYDGLLRLRSVQPPAGGAPGQTFEYDYLGRMTERTRGGATGSVWSTTYSNGVAELRTPTQDKIATLLDGRGRSARVAYTPGPASADSMDIAEVTYAYDGVDGLLKVVETRHDSTSTTVGFSYDARNLLTSITRGGEEPVSYGYTASGQREFVKVGSSAANLVSYGYDAKGRLNLVTSARGLTQVEWEPWGGNLQLVSDTTLVQRRCYDGVGRMTAIVNAPGGSAADCASPPANAFASFKYTYDARGNRLTENSGGTGYPSTGTTTYGYDAADRLTGVRYPTGDAVLYALAADGTRLGEKEVAGYGASASLGPDAYGSASGAGAWLTYQYDARGGLAGIRDGLSSTVLTSFVTDASGRVTSRVQAGTTTQYDWDAAGRLTKVTTGGAPGTTAQYAYDYAGLRRTQAVGSSVRQSWLYAGDELLQERWPTVIPARGLQYERIGSLVLAAGDERILHDELGSAVGRVKTDGTLAASRFDAWGGYRNGTGPTAAQASIGYTGHSWDAEAGLTYAQQRWYDVATGRFLSEDPMGAWTYLGTPNELSPWLYTAGNPLRYVDPSGERAKTKEEVERIAYFLSLAAEKEDGLRSPGARFLDALLGQRESRQVGILKAYVARWEVAIDAAFEGEAVIGFNPSGMACGECTIAIEARGGLTFQLERYREFLPQTAYATMVATNKEWERAYVQSGQQFRDLFEALTSAGRVPGGGSNAKTFARPPRYVRRAMREVRQANVLTPVEGRLEGESRLYESRKEAFNAAKDRAGVPRSSSPVKQWVVGDDPVRNKGSDNYVYLKLPSDPKEAELVKASFGRYYLFETSKGPRVVSEHNQDPAKRPHFHAGQPKGLDKARGVDFSQERYQQVGGKHHYFHGPPRMGGNDG